MIRQKLIGKVIKYPKTGPIPNQSEMSQISSHFTKFQILYSDAYFTTEILQSLNQKRLLDSINVVNFNHNRMNGNFGVANQYQKVPKDTLRVNLLYMSLKIGAEIKNKNKDVVCKYMQAIIQGVELLDKKDIHITQVQENLQRFIMAEKSNLSSIYLEEDMISLVNYLNREKAESKVPNFQ